MSCSNAFTAVLLFCNVIHASKPAQRQPNNNSDTVQQTLISDGKDVTLPLCHNGNILKLEMCGKA